MLYYHFQVNWWCWITTNIHCKWYFCFKVCRTQLNRSRYVMYQRVWILRKRKYHFLINFHFNFFCNCNNCYQKFSNYLLNHIYLIYHQGGNCCNWNFASYIVKFLQNRGIFNESHIKLQLFSVNLTCILHVSYIVDCILHNHYARTVFLILNLLLKLPM